jgi:hypothetical protein
MARFTGSVGSGEGIPGPQGEQGAPGADGSDGADALWNFLGEWQNGIDYAAGSVVEFQGSSYYHPTGQFSSYSPPTNGWLLVSSKGDTGENGSNGADGADGSDGAPGANGNDGSPGLVYLGNYVSGNGYLANVAVVKGSDNNLYIATSSGGLGDPVGNAAEWSIFLPKGAPGADGEDATLPQDLGTTDSPTFSKITLTNNGAMDNITIGDDVILGDGNVANHLVVVGIQDSTKGGIVLGDQKTESISSDGLNLSLEADTDIVLYPGSSYAYVGTPTIGGETRIATIGDISNATPDETSFTVNGGSLGTMPTFTGAPLFSGSYVKTGPLVHFQIQVDMDNITNFGTGQYYVDLPFPAKYGYKFREGCLHDISATRDYEIGGHVLAGQSRLVLTSTDAQGNSVYDIPFVYNNPTTLAVADNFHISGTYIAE